MTDKEWNEAYCEGYSDALDRYIIERNETKANTQ